MNVLKRDGVEDARPCRRPAPSAKPETFFATWHIASSGFETTMITASGLCATTSSVTEPTIFSFVVDEVVAAHPGRARQARR